MVWSPHLATENDDDFGTDSAHKRNLMDTSLPCVAAAPSNGFAAQDWPKIGGRPACFFAEMVFPRPSDVGPLSGTHVYFFRGNEPGSWKGQPLKIPCFALVEHRADAKPVTHHLLQDDNVFFASKIERARIAALPKSDPKAHFDDPIWKARFEIQSDAFGVLHDALKTGDICDELEQKVIADYESAGKPTPRKKWLKERLLPEYRWLKTRPRWVEDEGQWPAFLGQQMLFVGQTAVPDNEVAQEYSLSDEMIYLFAGWSERQTDFKLLSQDVGAQTAEQHYLAEELMALYSQSPKDPKTIRRCVDKGDQYVHEFLLGQASLKPETLKLLSQKGANKTIREKAKNRLK
jgi:hypothetical protein